MENKTTKHGTHKRDPPQATETTTQAHVAYAKATRLIGSSVWIKADHVDSGGAVHEDVKVVRDNPHVVVREPTLLSHPLGVHAVALVRLARPRIKEPARRPVLIFHTLHEHAEARSKQKDVLQAIRR